MVFFIAFLLLIYYYFIILFIIYFIFMLCPQLASAKYIDTWIKFIIIIITARKDIVKIIVLLVINLMGIHGYLQCKFSIWLLNFACLNFTRIYFRGSLISQFFFTITTLKTHRIKCQYGIQRNCVYGMSRADSMIAQSWVQYIKPFQSRQSIQRTFLWYVIYC